MMRLLCALLLIAILATSCEEGWNETTVQVINDIERFETVLPDYNGTIYNCYIYYFIEEDNAESISIGKIAPGDSSDVIVLDKKATKAKVSFKLLPGSKVYKNMYWNIRYFDVVFHYLEKNEHHEIVVSEKTMFSPKLFFETGEREMAMEDIIQ